MKAQVEINQTYNITVDGKKHEDCKRINDWEGMTKFQTQGGEVIILDTEGVNILLAQIFMQPAECDIVKIAPSMIGGS